VGHRPRPLCTSSLGPPVCGREKERERDGEERERREREEGEREGERERERKRERAREERERATYLMTTLMQSAATSLTPPVHACVCARTRVTFAQNLDIDIEHCRSEHVEVTPGLGFRV
jgi:hypothetical protein